MGNSKEFRVPALESKSGAETSDSPATRSAGLPFGPHRCLTASNYVIELIDKLLAEESEKHGGQLSTEQIAHTLERVSHTPQGLWDFFTKTFEDCRAASKLESHQNYDRSDYFLRLITESFSQQFPESAGDADVTLILPRHIIHPFHAALQAMLGKDTIAKHRESCARTVGDLQRKHGEHFTWKDFYTDDRSLGVLVQTCASIALYFGDFKKREKWFLNFLNENHKAEAAKNQSMNGAYEYTEHHFEVLTTCLYEVCHQHITASGGRAWLAKWLDDEEIDAIESFIANLDQFGLFDALGES